MTTTESREYERDFKGVWIPKEIYLNTQLNWTEKILLVEIDSLDNENGCFATNSYLAEFLELSEKTVSRAISKLKKLGFIETRLFNGRTRVLKSKISLESCLGCLDKNEGTDWTNTSSLHGQKCLVSYNSINNTNNKKIEDEDKFVHPAQTGQNNISSKLQEPTEYEKLQQEHQSNQIPIARHTSQNWQKVNSEFIKTYGDNAYTNWFRDKLILIKETENEIIMQGQTGFVCEFVNKTYLKGIQRINRETGKSHWVRKGIREFWMDIYPNLSKDKIRILTEPQILELKQKEKQEEVKKQNEIEQVNKLEDK